jgi:hypothetical protein
VGGDSVFLKAALWDWDWDWDSDWDRDWDRDWGWDLDWGWDRDRDRDRTGTGARFAPAHGRQGDTARRRIGQSATNSRP